MENKIFTIVNKEDEARFLADLNANPDNFKKKLIFVFGNSENYIVVNGEKFLHKPESVESTAVDLGLPSGLKWATCNVGASSPEQSGLYFAWGETTGYTAEQVTSGVRVFNKDVYNAGPVASISADLTLEQDAAHVNLGGNWRMPTEAEYQELIDNCDVTWTNDYNGTKVSGRIFTSKVNGKLVFFPAAGNCLDSSVVDVGSYGVYWSASWRSSSNAWELYFLSGSQGLNYNYRYYGYSVRGVCE